MLTEYVAAALRHAHYELMEDGQFFAEVPELPGVWAAASTLEACREELREVIEGWLLLGLRHGDAIPALDGISLEVQQATG